MNYFNLLPSEIIEIIFKKLTFNNLINLKNVDKRFKLICEQIRIKELIVSNKINYNNDLMFWYYTNDIVNRDNLIDITKFINYRSIFRLDKNLKRLFLKVEETFNLSILNEFNSIEQLYIQIIQFNNNYELNLDKLKIFEIDRSDENEFKLILNTPNLFAFMCNKLKNDLIFKYAERILNYETDNYENEIIKFTNLENLKLNEFYTILDKELLSKFTNLRILDLNTDLGIIDKEEYENLKENINYLINKKNILKRSKFKIYFEGVELIDENKINQLKWGTNYLENKYNNLKFQINNYNLLKDNCYLALDSCINYSILIKLLKTIPSSFMRKFSTLNQVCSNCFIYDENQFIKFLNNLPYLTVLKLKNCELTTIFYHKLINTIYLNNLNTLKIEEKINLGINFNFIINMKKLIYFDTNQQIINIDLVSDFLIKQIPNFFTFKLDNKNHIEIHNQGEHFKINLYYLDMNCKKISKFSIENIKLNDLILNLRNLKF